jgi:hypothetical protein
MWRANTKMSVAIFAGASEAVCCKFRWRIVRWRSNGGQ